jgi:hypothetical protein
LVKTATSKRRPAQRSWSSACELTSSATASPPISRCRTSSSCSAGASGVVCVAVSSVPSARRLPAVPSTAARMPAACSSWPVRWVVVVLPFVPVTPTTNIERAGEPQHSAAASPATRRAWGCTHCNAGEQSAAGSGRGVRTASAPRSSAGRT